MVATSCFRPSSPAAADELQERRPPSPQPSETRKAAQQHDFDGAAQRGASTPCVHAVGRARGIAQRIGYRWVDSEKIFVVLCMS